MGLITAVRVFPNSLVENNRNIPKSNSILFQDEKIILKIGDTETTYSVDFMFDSITTQEEIYNSCIEDMIEKFLGGKNVNLIVIGEVGYHFLFVFSFCVQMGPQYRFFNLFSFTDTYKQYMILLNGL